MPYRHVDKPYKPRPQVIKNRCRQIREQWFLYEGKKRHEPWPQERLDRQEGLTAAVVVGRDIWGDDFQEIEQE